MAGSHYHHRCHHSRPNGLVVRCSLWVICFGLTLCERSRVRTPVGPAYFFLYHVADLYGYLYRSFTRSVPSQASQECPSNSEQVLTRMTNMFVYGNTRPRPSAEQVSPSMVSMSHRDDYKHSKEAFVSGMTGSTVFHVNMIALVALVCCILSFYKLHLLTINPQGLYCAALRHPLTLTTTELSSLLFRMATPRYPPSSLNDSFCSPPRRTIRHLTSSHRVHMLLFPAVPVRYTSAFRRNALSPCTIRVAPRIRSPSRQTVSTRRGVGRGARDDAFVRVEYLPRAYDARDCARDPRG